MREQAGKRVNITVVSCITRDGAVLTDCTLDVFLRLQRQRLIASRVLGGYLCAHNWIIIRIKKAAPAYAGAALNTHKSPAALIRWPYLVLAKAKWRSHTV
ncbi:MAG: YjhX family toxin [Pseudomonadota bacterium]